MFSKLAYAWNGYSFFSKLAYAIIKNGKKSYASQLIFIVDSWNLVWVLIFSKLAYAMIKMGNIIMYLH